MLSLKSGDLVFEISEDARSHRWEAPGTALESSENADFWRAYLDDGYEREMTVRSSRQTGRAVLNGDCLTVVYDSLTGDNGRVFDVTLTVEITACVST
ncbi:MAG: hypothetical protein IK047_02265, partial [Clostridia bacterium]|nr:hypothetical protein [Clostridia bacterium]